MGYKLKIHLVVRYVKFKTKEFQAKKEVKSRDGSLIFKFQEGI